jgi:hypothetical protein
VLPLLLFLNHKVGVVQQKSTMQALGGLLDAAAPAGIATTTSSSSSSGRWIAFRVCFSKDVGPDQQGRSRCRGSIRHVLLPLLLLSFSR